MAQFGSSFGGGASGCGVLDYGEQELEGECEGGEGGGFGSFLLGKQGLEGGGVCGCRYGFRGVYVGGGDESVVCGAAVGGREDGGGAEDIGGGEGTDGGVGYCEECCCSG